MGRSGADVVVMDHVEAKVGQFELDPGTASGPGNEGLGNGVPSMDNAPVN